MKSVALTPASIADDDCVLIATNSSAYDWQTVADHAKLTVDTRNALSEVTDRRDHVVKA